MISFFLLSESHSALLNINMNLLLQASLIEKRKFALIVVDVQNDFITGSLAVAGGKKVLHSVELFSQGVSLHRC